MPTKAPVKPKPADIPMPPDFDPEFTETFPISTTGTPPDPDPVNGEYVVIEKEEHTTSDAQVMVIPPPTSNSVIVGLGALAAMSDEEYEAKKAIMARGLARVEDLQKTLMVDKQDYGRVPGISKPFLQLSGAEKLANFYGYAVRQEVDRLIGDGLTAPPLAYIVRSYVHLGSFDGPVVGMGSGECNSWEDKYRYRFDRPICPTCGKAELMRGKPGAKMEGKWFCPGFKGGCWANWPLESPLIKPGGKVENTEPYGLAETLIQMAAKRSFVASIRRATGTSGLFSQDDDSPSVQDQAEDEGDAGEIKTGPVQAGITVKPGARTNEATQLQHDRLKVVAKEKGLNGQKIADLLLRLFDMEVEPTGAAASAAVRTLNGDQMGSLLRAIETGEVPEAIEATPGFPPQSSDEM